MRACGEQPRQFTVWFIKTQRTLRCRSLSEAAAPGSSITPLAPQVLEEPGRAVQVCGLKPASWGRVCRDSSNTSADIQMLISSSVSSCIWKRKRDI